MKIPAFFLCGLVLPNNLKLLRSSTALAVLGACLGLIPLTSSAIDLDSDGLDDVWQEYFGASALLPGDDEDRDGETNLEECIAGTDPYDAESCHAVEEFSGNSNGASIMFPSVDGKCYQLQTASNLVDFANRNAEMHGTGGMISIAISNLGESETTGLVSHEVWTGIAGTAVADLTGDANYPGNPSGTQGLGSLETPSNVDNDYGGRIRGSIKAPATGSYTFYLASRDQGELWLSTDASPTNKTLVASVANGSVAPREWAKFASQSSGAIALVAGEKYYFEVLHKHGADDDHCAVGWEGPGLPAGIQVVDGDFLCPATSEGIVNPDPTDQVVYYPLDGDAVDASGGNDGMIVGGAVFKGAGAGLLNDALTLDGIDDQVNIADSADINDGGPWTQRTIAVWFKADAPTGTRQVIFEEGGQTNGLNIYLDSGVLHCGAYVGNGVNYDAFLDTPLTDTNWHHVAIVLDASVPGSETFKGYLDGSEFGSVAAGPMLGHGGDIAIGAINQDTQFHDGDDDADTGFFFAGCVDEFHLFNRVLSAGEIAGLANASEAAAPSTPLSAGLGFVRVTVKDLDQDGDGLSDYAEKLMSGEGNFSPFDGNSTTSGSDDLTTVTDALGASSESIAIAVVDAEACEDPRDGAAVTAGTPAENVTPDTGRFRIQRTGTLQPVTVKVSFPNPYFLEDQDAEAGDYDAVTADGGSVTDQVTLGFGQVAAEVAIVPGLDSEHEYPEKVTLRIDPDTDPEPDYTISGGDSAEVELVDALDIPEQQILLVAFSTPEPGAVNPQGSAVVSGKMSGKKNHMTLNTIISSGFSSPQDDSHIHKSNAGGGGAPIPGPIVYAILNTPGQPTSDPLLGEIGPDYPYPIVKTGSITGQKIVNAFFAQGESPMYLNWHTANNSSGELWAIFTEADGSIDPPVHDPMPGHTLLTGDALERDIYRFLNQATFGATDDEVQVIKGNIEAARAGGDPNYSRITEFENWIDAQAGLDQTYLLDYLIALKNQDWMLRDEFDPSVWYDMAEFPNNTALPPDDPAQTWTVAPIPVIAPSVSPNPLMMPLPTAWPGVDRSAATTGGDPLQWRFTENYPVTPNRISWGDDRDNRGDPLQLPRQRWNGSRYLNNNYDKWARRDLGRPNENTRYLIHWMMAVNAHDQLRQKMGFALQQICVVANTQTIIQDRDMGMANYQDQLNRMAFSKYRDIIDWVMVSPQMGWWLSSFNNQKAADINGDMIIDVFPDENLAREVMQLFTCGLFLLHPDGSLALDSENGLPQATYTNDDITELARVITGHGYGKYITGNGNTEYANFDNPIDNTGNNSFSRGAGDARVEQTFNYPMKMFGKYHDIDPKTILGGKVINNSGLADGTGATGNNDTDPSWNDETAVGDADMKDALDWLAGIPGDGQPDFDQVSSHQSTAPFITRRLIQRFVTSNPSPAYLERVAVAFRDGYNGGGGEGDLMSACKAMLLDWEARDPGAATATFGLKKSPYEAYVHLLRAFDAHSQTPVNPLDGSEPASFSGVGNYDEPTNPDLYLQNFGYPANQRDNFRLNTQYRYNATENTTLNMSPMNQPTVFNFYLPDYTPGGIIADSALVSPEMMLANDTSIYRNINYFYNVTLSTSANNSGESERDLTRANDTFQVASGATNNERIRIDSTTWGPLLYPATGTELERDTALFDEIDRRLTGGLFKAKYPWDPSDDELTDPTIDINGDGEVPDNDGVNPAFSTTGDGNINNDSELMNPREAIIRFMGEAYGTTGNGPRDKFRYGLYLLTTSPDYLVRQ